MLVDAGVNLEKRWREDDESGDGNGADRPGRNGASAASVASALPAAAAAGSFSAAGSAQVADSVAAPRYGGGQLPAAAVAPRDWLKAAAEQREAVAEERNCSIATAGRVIRGEKRAGLYAGHSDDQLVRALLKTDEAVRQPFGLNEYTP